MKYLESIQKSLEDLLSSDDRVYIIGEDILDPYGGAFRATKSLSTKFPGRLIPTPISEAAITGIGTGMAIRGLRPIVEIMFGDFLSLSFDQLLNSASKFPLMYKSKVTVPLVIRTPMGAGRGYGPTHSQSLEKHFLGMPGLNIVAPSIFHNPGELLKNATLKDNGPVLFIENKILYSKEIVETSDILDLQFIGSDIYPTAQIKNYFSPAVPDVAVFTYGGTSELIREIMVEFIDEEINILAICPSLISDFNLSHELNLFSHLKRILIVEEGCSGFNWGSEVATVLYEKYLNKLDRKIERISSEYNIIPASKQLEQEHLPNKDKIVQRIINLIS